VAFASIDCAQTSHTCSHPLLVCQVLQRNERATGKWEQKSHLLGKTEIYLNRELFQKVN